LPFIFHDDYFITNAIIIIISITITTLFMMN